mmetsp:Transcript_27923/g.38610  ORF Transcript_27923/g.38610 Transcript_27923/m.38610 type:complete len:85 (+) Transcript_27923:1284-1538(+)
MVKLVMFCSKQEVVVVLLVEAVVAVVEAVGPVAIAGDHHTHNNLDTMTEDTDLIGEIVIGEVAIETADIAHINAKHIFVSRPSI